MIFMLASWALTLAFIFVYLRAHLRLVRVARATHELRGPLFAVGLGLHGLGGEPARLAALELELARAGRALDDLAAAPSGAKSRTAHELVDLTDLVAAYAPSWRTLAAGYGAELRLEPTLIVSRFEAETDPARGAWPRRRAATRTATPPAPPTPPPPPGWPVQRPPAPGSPAPRPASGSPAPDGPPAPGSPVPRPPAPGSLVPSASASGSLAPDGPSVSGSVPRPSAPGSPVPRPSAPDSPAPDGASATRRPAPRATTTVFADPLRIAQACANLVGNAAEHGGGVVRVRVRATGHRVLIEVADDGPGLPASVSALTATARARRGPRGHGLAIAAAIAEHHGGRLHAAPSDRGARLMLEMPAAHDPAAA